MAFRQGVRQGLRQGVPQSVGSPVVGVPLNGDTVTYLAAVASAGGTLTTAEILAANTWFNDVSAIKSSLKRVNLFLGDQLASLVPAYKAWGTNGPDTTTGSPTYDRTRGWLFDGAGARVNTGFVASTQVATTTDAHWFAWAQRGATTGANRYIMGAVSNSGNNRWGGRFVNSNSTLNLYLGLASEIAHAPTGYTTGWKSGHYGVVNNGGLNSTSYVNGASFATTGVTETNSPPSVQMYIGTGDGTTEHFDKEVSGYSLGLNITTLAQTQAYYVAWTRLISAIGRMYNLAAWGDSLTATGSSDWLANLVTTEIPRASSYNGGVGGENTTQIKTRFDADVAAGATHKWWNTVIWSGRNDIGGAGFNTTVADQVIAQIAAMAASLGHTHYRVLQPTPADLAAEYIGGAKRAAMQYLWDGLAATFGTRYVNLLTPLQAAGTGTGQDAIDVANGVIPVSLRVDSTHLTTGAGTTGNSIVEVAVANAVSGGW